MSIMVGNDLFLKLRETLNLPRHCTWLELRIAIDEIVTVRCGFAVSVEHHDKAVTHVDEVLGEYALVEKAKPTTALEVA